MKWPLKIFEHSSIPISSDREEADSYYLSSGEIEKIEILNAKIKTRDRLALDIVSFRYRAEKAYELCSYSHVGVIAINNKIIQIMPKMSKHKDNNQEAINNLLYMLSYTKKLNISESSIASLTKTNNDFYEVLIHLFAKNLLQIIQNDVNKEYITEEENLPYIRGKLQISTNIKQNVFARHMFYMRYDSFSEDNMLNKVLKYVVTILRKSSRNLSNQNMLQQLDYAFAEVKLQKIIIGDFSKISLNRLNKSYEPILNLCKLIISDSTVKMSSNNIETFSFLFDMNVLFEEFIGEFIKRELNLSKVSLQKPVRYLIQEKNNLSHSIFMMRPDIQIFSNGKRNPDIIIDTKYKLPKNDNSREGISQPDMYQMYAYSKIYSCQNIILLYPRQDNEIDDSSFMADKNTFVFKRNIDLNRDIKTNKEAIKHELNRIINISVNSII